MSPPRYVCDKCKNQRWVVWLLSWDRVTGKRVGSWKPFDRARWQAHGDLTIAAMELRKALVPCDKCNPDGVAPWDELFKEARDAGPAEEGLPSATGAPF